VNVDALKLTTYFGERERTPEGLLSERLLALYDQHEVQASVLLRGTEGFGAHHRLRTDRLLTLSEDLPVVSLAIDRRERIEALVEPVLALRHRGLVTLERARMTLGEVSPLCSSKRLHESSKLTVYLGRREHVRGAPAFLAICELLRRNGVAGASVLLGVDGIRHGLRARARFFSRNADVPMMVIAVGAEEHMAAALAELPPLLREPLLTLERVRVCKRDGRLLARPHELPASDAQGRALWRKLTIFSSQGVTHEGRPLSQQLVRRLRAANAAGATSLRGIWGFHGEHPPHGDRLLQLRRHVPALTVAIDAPERGADAFAIVDELTAEHGLVTSELVPAPR
jgi:PII-like signaling protein